MIYYLLLTVLVISTVDSTRIKAIYPTIANLLHDSSFQVGDNHSGLQYHPVVDKRSRHAWICALSPIVCIVLLVTSP
ncbi:unnamed protein product [Trichobilharzia szidati]|nr:unnamed protein product [Trichobilharzia szidati]